MPHWPLSSLVRLQYVHIYIYPTGTPALELDHHMFISAVTVEEIFVSETVPSILNSKMIHRCLLLKLLH